jgi:hypothetical protein
LFNKPVSSLTGFPSLLTYFTIPRAASSPTLPRRAHHGQDHPTQWPRPPLHEAGASDHKQSSSSKMARQRECNVSRKLHPRRLWCCLCSSS